MKKRVWFHIVGLLVIIAILLLVFTYNYKDNKSDKSNLEVYDAVDASVNEFLSNESGSQKQNV